MEEEIDELRKKCIELRKKIKRSVQYLTEYACLCSDSGDIADDDVIDEKVDVEVDDERAGEL